ncbi:ubiquitin fusion degradation protein UFD1-domain-containing protein [Dimargaris cristalligena]|uniref:Ubiquitin fusion degradation protein UFD1-domain-containing protein n=1 Tax=Dimargaris cristalligena TaxID=215637 RepID=A0A4P9ZME9_9FUNG|nr:ubiquitin fusion degradation protein UFD1-domain-containing protein [Dimargaris cristalligena]|eukprot:RKP34447.1 ubiquitin fusion degradation protein UFD1-domain-containing protein [Dimargaris cristalligena]
MDSNSTTLSFRQIFLIYPHEGRTALRQASGNRRNLLNTDRLVLPASVLEALLHGRSSLAPSAHSNTYAAAPWPGVSAPISNSAGPLASNRELPHPLTFTVRNPRSHNIAYAGVEEFSAEPLGDLVTNSASASEHYSPLLAPLRLMEALASAPGEAVELELIVLPKATGAQLRPLDAGYRSIGDLRAALEAHLRSNFTTLATHDIITVPHGRHNYRFEVEQVQPGPAATVIDTDIAVDIIPFQEPIGIDPSSTEPSEPQGSTLESQGLSPTSSSLPNQDNASAMDGVEATDNQGTIKLDRPVRGTLSQQRRSHAWRFQADSDIPHIHLWLEASDGSVDIFVQPGTEPASYRDHLVASFSSQTTKQLDIAVDNTRNPSREFQINIIRFIDELDSTDMAGPVSYQLRITREPFGEVESDHLLTPAPVDESADQKTCPNCQTTVPSRSYELHATFCARNNTRCPACHRVLKRGEQADNHWHCDQCDTVSCNIFIAIPYG